MAQGKTTDQTSLYRDRRSFAKIPDVMDVPNLIAIQTDSFEFFKGEGLAQAFQDISPIENNTKDMCVEFGRHESASRSTPWTSARRRTSPTRHRCSWKSASSTARPARSRSRTSSWATSRS